MKSFISVLFISLFVLSGAANAQCAGGLCQRVASVPVKAVQVTQSVAETAVSGSVSVVRGTVGVTRNVARRAVWTVRQPVRRLFGR